MNKKRIVLAVAVMLQQSTLRSQDAKENLDSLPTDSIAIVSLNLEAVRNHPDLALTPWEVVSAFSSEQLGIDVLKSRSIELCVGMPGPAGPEFGAMIQTKEKVDIGDLRMPGLGPIERSPKNAQLRFRKLSDAPVRIAQQEPQTIIAGTDATLRRILAARPAKSEAVSLLKESSDPIRIVAALDTVRPLLQGLLEDNFGNFPPPILAPLQVLADEVKFVRLTSSVGMESTYNLSVVGVGPGSVEKIRTALIELRDVGMQIAEQEFRNNLSREPDFTPAVRQAMEQYIVRLKGVLKNEYWSIEGERLTVELKGASSVATIGVLTGLLLPAVQAAREAARRMQGSNNMKQLQLATLNYESAYKKFPARNIVSKDGKPLLSWRVALLPFLEQNALYQQFHLDEPWDSPHNRQLIAKMPATYQDPQAPAPPGYTCYVAPYEKGTAWSGGALQLRQVTDGTSNTLSFLQVAGPKAVAWTSPDDLDVTGMSPAQIFPRNGANAVLMDGSVRFLSSTIDVKVFRALLTHQGGEVVNLD
jgi:hypothetical protein